MKTFDIISTRANRIDTPDKATGKAVFVDDITLPGMLYGAMLQSPHAHAKIVSIDTSEAAKLPGVKAVITAKEAGRVKYGVSPARYDETVFAVDKVRYVGDEIAAVAATRLDIALEAVSLIKVEYEVLPAVFTVEDAVKEGAPQLHEDFKGNLCAEVHQEFGNVAEGLENSDIVITTEMKSKRQDGAFIEPQGCIAEYDNRGVLTLTSSTQVPHYVQRTVAMVLGMDVGRVRHQFHHTINTGAKKDGTLMALKHECWLDGGDYTSFGIATVYYTGSLLGGPYKLANMCYDGYRVYNNKPACGAQRGHGAVIARACFEQQLDMIAEKIGMDPLELRIKNMMETGDTTCNDLNMSSFGMSECIEAVRNGSDWDKKKGSMPPGKGIGMAMHEEVIFDNQGRVLNDDLAEYKIVTSMDMPRVNTIVVESDEPNGPFGAKEVGEGAIMPTIPAILNAVYDAAGVRIHALPLTPERVFQAIQEYREPNTASA